MSSSLAYQMNDFQNSIDDFKKKFDDIYFCSEEIVNDYDNAKKSVCESSAYSEPEIDEARLEKVQKKLSDNIFSELNELTEQFIKLNEVIDEAEHFKQLELEFRKNFEQHPEAEFDERQFKTILDSKHTSTRSPKHPAFEKLQKLIDNAKNGVFTEEDLVMETQENEHRVNKCPITLKDIEEEWKNPKCGHIYEKSAIFAYCQRKQRKCPIAGCTQTVKPS